MNRKILSSIALWVGVCAPLAIVLLSPSTYFYYDVNLFWSRAPLWRESWRDIYLLCEACDYTFLGTALTAGFMSLFLEAGQTTAVMVYRMYLALFDGANVFLIFYLLKHFRAPQPHWLAAAAGVSIGFWAGSAFWGQIEGVTQFLILLALVLAVRKNAQERSLRYYLAYLAALGLIVAALLLTKQLGVFSTVALVILAGADILFCSRNWKDFGLYSAVGIGTVLLALALVDAVVRVPEGYLSHLQYVFSTGGSHTGAYYLSVNGINLWMFLEFFGRPMVSPAEIPLFGSSALFSPHVIGRGLFLLVSALCAIPLARLFAGGKLVGRGANLSPDALGRLILYLAMVNLAFNLFLTGTHERYLYHFFPAMLVAWYALAPRGKAPARWFIPYLFALYNLYGIFELIILKDYRALWIWPHLFIGILSLLAFIYLFQFFIRMGSPSPEEGVGG